MKIFNLATYNRPHSCLRTLESIYDQADVINLVINCGWAGPSDPKINVFHKNNDLGDGYKFLMMEQSNGYYFTIDDDIIYPPNYSEFMIDGYNKLKTPAVVTLHGRIYKKCPLQSYYNDPYYIYHFRANLVENKLVQVGGSGVMMIDTNILKISMPFCTPEQYRMADCCLAKHAKQNNIPIICLKHKDKFLKSQITDGSIFESEKSNDKYLTYFFNKYIA